MQLQAIIDAAKQRNASDLHLTTNLPPIIRCNGELQPLSDNIVLPGALADILKPLLPEHLKSHFSEQRQCDFSLNLDRVGRFRVNIFRQQDGLAAVFRFIPSHIPHCEDLHLPDRVIQSTQLSQGLVLITGATGCGKSTTLASLLQHINHTQAKHILTIEDPIEFIHDSERSIINQRQVGRDALSFETALHGALRADPDIIMLGELRDLPTIRLALTAAETGHLVFATLHTLNAAKTIDRIIGVFSSAEQAFIRTQLAESLQLVVSQQLVKTAAGNRRAAFEIMPTTPAIRNLIRENKLNQISGILQSGQQQGMQTMAQGLAKLNSL